MANWDHKSNIGTHPNIDNGARNTLDNLAGGRPPTLSDSADSHVPVGSLVTVTIGRNVGDRPMTNLAWSTFRANVRANLDRELGGTTFGPFDGLGQWDGLEEESTAFTHLSALPVSVKRLDNVLASLARLFEQDAIAWSYGQARLAH